jgi:hypothetical protein
MNQLYRALHMPPVRLAKKLMGYREIYTIAVRRIDPENPLPALSGAAFVPLPQDADTWYADPILVQEQGARWVFCEAFHRAQGRGGLAVFPLREDGTFGPVQPVLESRTHLSFPMVFRWNGGWWMIPESSADHTLCLYRCVVFPGEWVLAQSFDVGCELCDTIVTAQTPDALTLLCSETKPENQLYVRWRRYTLRRTGPGAALALEPDEAFAAEHARFDLVSRNAGPLFRLGGRTVHPTQVSTKVDYGVYLQFWTPRGEKAIPLCSAEPRTVEIAGLAARDVVGIHTYCRDDAFEVIDARYLARWPRAQAGAGQDSGAEADSGSPRAKSAEPEVESEKQQEKLAAKAKRQKRVVYKAASRPKQRPAAVEAAPEGERGPAPTPGEEAGRKPEPAAQPAPETAPKPEPAVPVTAAESTQAAVPAVVPQAAGPAPDAEEAALTSAAVPGKLPSRAAQGFGLAQKLLSRPRQEETQALFEGEPYQPENYQAARFPAQLFQEMPVPEDVPGEEPAVVPYPLETETDPAAEPGEKHKQPVPETAAPADVLKPEPAVPAAVPQAAEPSAAVPVTAAESAQAAAAAPVSAAKPQEGSGAKPRESAGQKSAAASAKNSQAGSGAKPRESAEQKSAAASAKSPQQAVPAAPKKAKRTRRKAGGAAAKKSARPAPKKSASGPVDAAQREPSMPEKPAAASPKTDRGSCRTVDAAQREPAAPEKPAAAAQKKPGAPC